MTIAAPSGERFNVRVPKTAELVASRIVTGDLLEGDALPLETALMEEFAISRPTLREAFRILESEGLITVRRGARGGARVQVPSPDVAARYAGLVLQHRGTTLTDVLDARVIAEAPSARMLASRRDRGSIATKLQEKLDSHELRDSEHSHQFNAFVVELTGNETLVLLTTMLEHISQAATAMYARAAHPDDDKLARNAHRTRQRLIDHIRAGEADQAELLWRNFLSESGDVVAKTIGANVVDLFN